MCFRERNVPCTHLETSPHLNGKWTCVYAALYNTCHAHLHKHWYTDGICCPANLQVDIALPVQIWDSVYCPLWLDLGCSVTLWLIDDPLHHLSQSHPKNPLVLWWMARPTTLCFTPQTPKCTLFRNLWYFSFYYAYVLIIGDFNTHVCCPLIPIWLWILYILCILLILLGWGPHSLRGTHSSGFVVLVLISVRPAHVCLTTKLLFLTLPSHLLPPQCTYVSSHVVNTNSADIFHKAFAAALTHSNNQKSNTQTSRAKMEREQSNSLISNYERTNVRISKRSHVLLFLKHHYNNPS